MHRHRPGRCVPERRSPETFAAAQRATLESSLVVTGQVRQDRRAPASPADSTQRQRFADRPTRHRGISYRPQRTWRRVPDGQSHLWLRSSRQWAVMRIRSTIIQAIRDWLDDNGFLNVDTPILTPSACEDTTTCSRRTISVSLRSSHNGPALQRSDDCCVRQKSIASADVPRGKSKTRRHLMEFWMVEQKSHFAT